MHDDVIQIIRDVFNEYPNFSLSDVKNIGSCVSASFVFQEALLELWVSNPGNKYTRKVLVGIQPESADQLKLPPHYMRLHAETQKSVLCLIDPEQHVLSSYSLRELIDLYLHQTSSLLNLSVRKINREYLKEFEYYWNAATSPISGIKLDAELYIPEGSQACNLDCWYYKENNFGKYTVFPGGTEFNSWNKPQGVIEKAIYVPIAYPEGVVPPQKDIPWSAIDLLDIFCSQTKDRISSESFQFLKRLNVENYKKLVVFSFKLQDSVTVSVSGILKFSNNKEKPFIDKIQEDFLSFTPINSHRMDLNYLHERVGEEHAILPSVLVLGCGSVGSYLIPELINMGVVRLGISDPDNFESGNALRHYFGPRLHGHNKSKALKDRIEFENPLSHIEVISDLTCMNEDQFATVVKKYQIIIVAVGGTDLQRELNYRFSKLKSTSWFVYNWLDAEGKGSHVLAMRYTQKGCYECLFHNHGEELSRCKFSFADGTEKVISNGCGGSFSPYGNEVLLRNTTLTIGVLQGILKGTINENTVVSIPNDFTSPEASISISPVFNCNFADKGCELCGNIREANLNKED